MKVIAKKQQQQQPKKTLVLWVCEIDQWHGMDMQVSANWGHDILQTGRAMCGIPVLSLRVNKLTTKDSQLAYIHRSDRRREGGIEVERGAREMRQSVFGSRERWEF